MDQVKGCSIGLAQQNVISKKLPGVDGVYLILLQNVPDTILVLQCGFLRDSMALGHILIAWKVMRVVFIPLSSDYFVLNLKHIMQSEMGDTEVHKVQ